MNRKDSVMAAAVNQGLFILLIDGNIVKAAKFMANKNVPIDVAKRVLLQPRLRRPTDWKVASMVKSA